MPALLLNRWSLPPRPPRLGVLLVAAALLAGLVGVEGSQVSEPPAGAVAAARGDRPDIVLVLTDDQRLESLAGMPHTQSLLVEQGRRFSHAMVPTALCCPSRSSLLTGLYAHDTRVFGNGDVGGPRFGGWSQFHRRGLEFRTIATTLHGAGYRTGFYGKYLNDFSRFAPDSYRPPGWDDFTAFKYSRGAYYDYRLTDGTFHGQEPADYSTDVLAERATRFVHRAPRNRPVFVVYAPYGPHDPYVPAPRHVDLPVEAPLTPGRAAVAAGASVSPEPEPVADGSQARRGSRDDDRPRWAMRRQAEDVAEVELVAEGQTRALLSVDEAVASLVDTMRETGRERDTLFVLMSDNGYLWGEHGMIGKDNPYAAATRVPLVMRWDGRIEPGSVDSRLALNVDVAGTLARAAGLPMDTDGLDLLGRRTRSGFVLEAMAGYRKRPAYCGWRTRHRMYVRWATGRTELYDYRRDPTESENLAGRKALREVERRMQRKAVRHCSPEPPGFDW